VALATDEPERFPVKAPKKAKPVRLGAAFVAGDRDGRLLLRKRVESGLLGGMTEVPTTAWTSREDGETGVHAAPFPADWQSAGAISHVFTHFELKLSIFRTGPIDIPPGDHGFWVPVVELDGEALPTVMKKAIVAAIPTAFPTPKG
jgi:A/G-specific adenine glycosylase